MALQSSEYILKMSDYSSHFFAGAEKLFHDEILTDVTLCCENQIFESHRFVLSVCSPYFGQILTESKNLANKHPIIFLRDISARDFKRLLEYMYTGEIKIPNCELESLIQTAKSLKILGLNSINPYTKEENYEGQKKSVETEREKETETESSSKFLIHVKSQSPLSVVKRISSFNKKRRLTERVHEMDQEDQEGEGSNCPVSPPHQTIPVPILYNDKELFLKSLAECRNTGTCFFCKKSFLKNTQLMNHVCPQKPRRFSDGLRLNSPSTNSRLTKIIKMHLNTSPKKVYPIHEEEEAPS